MEVQEQLMNPVPILSSNTRSDYILSFPKVSEQKNIKKKKFLSTAQLGKGNTIQEFQRKGILPTDLLQEPEAILWEACKM